ncbi:hypothetical protein [Calothrix sp. 336/3]|uniref:hypothetical protein n=1 Tax=Calothrix sp. 336/3 TaxID=1337936 RepID=UPI0004E40A8E|nr:hypothetical protein [Calothrix sp. 336/3]AKG24910.1 hypothetical protein IJ00_26570 [Calothrix sp. 336/3]
MQHNAIISNQEQNFSPHHPVLAPLVDAAIIPNESWVLEELTQQYGTNLEHLDSYSKQVLRASLSLYLCWLHKLTEQRADIPETLIDEAIDQADPDCWSSDRNLDQHISAIATLHPHDIESLLVILTPPISEMTVGQGREVA